MNNSTPPSPLATDDQRKAEKLALRLIEDPRIRAAREEARATLRADKVAALPDGYLGLDRALDQWILALTMRCINADPWRPKVLWNVYNAPRYWFGHVYAGAAVAIDNPDNSNREISVDGDSAYIIHGRFGKPATQFMIEIVVDFDHYAGIGRTLSALTTQNIVSDTDGNFTITIDSQLAHGRVNHLQSAAGKLNWMFMRDSMADWRQNITTLRVERTAGPPALPERTEDEIVGDIVTSMPVWVEFWRGFKDDFLGYPEPNRLVGPNGRPGGWGFLSGGRFHISGGQAVVITVTDGDANYTGCQISDPWTISPDPVTRLASLNKSQILPNPDDSITYVLAARDPGVHNWIDTVGLLDGWMMLRWQGVPATTDPATLVRSIKTVNLDDLASALPAGTPQATLASRSAQIARRIAEFAVRFVEE
ncbi:hypothetical protein GCM10010909_27780 [Acidocella aquatica]|uniref:DUF1214 domain-containing protein n=1 Tax=Acidocella aquatica TaxID=1922313 RepID=A0ABQ6A9X4_9PROT|nr:hypothetical protein [Acidocella aquatica]GLR68097.1 hypothetical protein GCM10010909_27780 [Acidocella aquatica]